MSKKISKKTTKKKIIKKSSKSNNSSKKKIISKPITDKTKKIFIKKDKPKKSTIPVKADSPPYDVNISGWKNQIKNSTKKINKPMILKTKSETWGKRQTELKENPVVEKGLFILVFANEKVGKTRLGCTPVKFKGYKGKKRIIPSGSPTYILDSENAVLDEAITNFQEEIEAGNLIIESYYVQNPETKKTDSKSTVEKLNVWTHALSNETEGTLVIDTFTEYCDCINNRLVNVVGKGFTKDDVPKKRLAPVQYSWRTKQVVEYLHSLREMKINKIVLCQAKDEYINPDPKNPFESYKTGQLLADALKKVYYWVDIICVMEKEEDDDGFITRKLWVKDSRFEDENTNKDELVLLNDKISLEGLINLFKHKFDKKSYIGDKENEK